ncbi:MAG: flagellar hook-basal body complex protein, partial [Oscillospiraceae bacterium]|nr:flagellar hook-basal body complex protein [Oscillospiraceae bacterium]
INTEDIKPGGEKLFGVQSKGGVTGSFDFAVKENGSFGNNYEITFAKKSGYGKTTASWEENNLTINICADTTIADVNEAIKKASGGDAKRIITFYNIEGLDYGEPTRIQEVDGSTTWEYALGYKYNTGSATATPPTQPGWVDRNNNPATPEEVAAAFKIAVGDLKTPAADSVAKDIAISKRDEPGSDPDRVVWNVATRDKFFGGNPQVRPTDGDDSFYTKTAKSLSTFNLTDGRIGEAQAMHNFTDYMIGSDGVIIGLHPVYGTMVLGRVDIATFDNPNGLEKVGGTNFRATVASGPAYIARPGEEGAGVVVPNALEMSNVDLADEFTNMITTQRGYQANSRVITVSDTMIEELLSLKR